MMVMKGSRGSSDGSIGFRKLEDEAVKSDSSSYRAVKGVAYKPASKAGYRLYDSLPPRL